MGIQVVGGTREHVQTQEEADSTEFDYFYERVVCEAIDVSEERATRWSGARLLVTDLSTDVALLEARSSQRSGAWLAGWLGHRCIRKPGSGRRGVSLAPKWGTAEAVSGLER